MKKDCCTNNHPDHTKELVKINRVIGQLEGIKKMIETRRYCVDVLNQFKASIGALKGCEASIFKTHLHACFIESLQSSNNEEKEEKIEEIIGLLKKY